MQYSLKKILVLTLIFLSSNSYSANTNKEFKVNQHINKFKDINNGDVVEGSVGYGGLQPNYIIDLNDEKFADFIYQSKQIGNSQLPFWDKINALKYLVRGGTFRYYNYYNPYYQKLIKSYRLKKQNIPLSAYFSCQAGVCREYALFFHLALKTAGIKNSYTYAKIYRFNPYENIEHIEDHAFNVIKHKGEYWVVDAYYWGFNGFLLRDLLSKHGINKRSVYSPIAEAVPDERRIIEIYDFPKVYNLSHRCENVFL